MNEALPETRDDLCLHRVEASASFFLANNSQKANKHDSSAFNNMYLSVCACMHVQPCASGSPFVYMYVFAHTLVSVCFLTRLEQQVQDKEMLERELYSRFVMVLNEKKAKIRELQDAVLQLQKADDQQRDEEGRQRSADFL